MYFNYIQLKNKRALHHNNIYTERRSALKYHHNQNPYLCPIMTGQNLHTHTHYSDGGKPPDDYVQQALATGMHALGFSDHSPLPFDNPFSVKEEAFDAYCTEIRQLKQLYEGRLNIFLGLEIDFIPAMSEDFAGLKKRGQLDYVIGSVHLVGSHSEENLWFTDGPLTETYDDGLQKFYGNDIRKAVKAFYHQTNRMIETQAMDVVGHFDKVKMHNQGRYFSEDEPWYRALAMETLELIRQKGLIAEVNTRGIYKKRCDSLFPSPWILEAMQQMDIPVLISSDAHLPDELQMLFPQALEAVKHAGYGELMVFGSKGWRSVSISD